MPTWQMRKPRHRVMAGLGPPLGFSTGSDLLDLRLCALSPGPHRYWGSGHLECIAWVSISLSVKWVGWTQPCLLCVPSRLQAKRNCDPGCKHVLEMEYVKLGVQNSVFNTPMETGVPRKPLLCAWEQLSAKTRGMDVGVRQNEAHILPFLLAQCVNSSRELYLPLHISFIHIQSNGQVHRFRISGSKVTLPQAICRTPCTWFLSPSWSYRVCLIWWIHLNANPEQFLHRQTLA